MSSVDGLAISCKAVLVTIAFGVRPAISCSVALAPRLRELREWQLEYKFLVPKGNRASLEHEAPATDSFTVPSLPVPEPLAVKMAERSTPVAVGHSSTRLLRLAVDCG